MTTKWRHLNVTIADKFLQHCGSIRTHVLLVQSVNEMRMFAILSAVLHRFTQHQVRAFLSGPLFVVKILPVAGGSPNNGMRYVIFQSNLVYLSRSASHCTQIEASKLKYRRKILRKLWIMSNTFCQFKVLKKSLCLQSCQRFQTYFLSIK